VAAGGVGAAGGGGASRGALTPGHPGAREEVKRESEVPLADEDRVRRGPAGGGHKTPRWCSLES
jgi:hypothetical protein